MRERSRSAENLLWMLVGLAVAVGVIWYSTSVLKQLATRNELIEQNYVSAALSLRTATEDVRHRMEENRAIVLGAEPPRVIEPNTTGSPPARPLDASPAPLLLQGISWNPDKPLALINHRVFQTGDRAGSYTIKEIRPRSIVAATDSGTEIEFKLAEEASHETHSDSP